MSTLTSRKSLGQDSLPAAPRPEAEPALGKRHQAESAGDAGGQAGVPERLLQRAPGEHAQDVRLPGAPPLSVTRRKVVMVRVRRSRVLSSSTSESKARKPMSPEGLGDTVILLGFGMLNLTVASLRFKKSLD